MNTGEKIKKIRKMAGMTQEELAEKMNVSRQTISKWEKGLSSPDLESAITLCGLFELSLDDFLKEDLSVRNEEKISLQDMMKINRRNQRMTILLISGLFFLATGLLAALFITALDSTITSLEYMLYRYIATGQYAYAPIDYHRLDILVLLLVLTGILLMTAYAIEIRKEKKKMNISEAERRKSKMNKKRVITGLILTAICLTACGKSQKENSYSLDSLGDDDAYAFLVMDHTRDVMVSSDQLYDAGMERQAAACCTVYYYGDDSTLELGTIQSDGTAYPLSFSKDGIFAASGHSIEKYDVSEEAPSLYLVKAAYVAYDESGNEHYTSITDGMESESTEEEYKELLEEYEKSQVIHFSYGADGCVNELQH